MSNINIGDLVARKSYNCDVLFKVVEIIDHSGRERVFILKGVNLRILADAPESDLVKMSYKDLKVMRNIYDDIVEKRINRIMNERKNKSSSRGIRNAFLYRSKDSFGRSGKVLHLDGDKEYLEMCLETYRKLEINVVGVHVPESEQPSVVGELLGEHLPDILVLTGHDSLTKGYKDIKDINAYRNSKYFVASVKEARKFDQSYDDLVIFAGACQSHFEAIIESGANFASSPKRVLIHALDPVFVCEKIAYSSIDKIVSVEELISSTITGIEGIGGLQTRGKYREGLPKSPFV